MDTEQLKEMQQQHALQQQVEQLELAVKTILTREALQRYTNLKIAHPEKAIRLLVTIAQLVQSNQIQKIGDAELKLLLEKMEPTRKTKITFK